MPAWLRVVRKEIRAGLSNGVTIAFMISLGVLVWSSSLGLALVIRSSMVIAIMGFFTFLEIATVLSSTL